MNSDLGSTTPKTPEIGKKNRLLTAFLLQFRLLVLEDGALALHDQVQVPHSLVAGLRYRDKYTKWPPFYGSSAPPLCPPRACIPRGNSLSLSMQSDEQKVDCV